MIFLTKLKSVIFKKNTKDQHNYISDMIEEVSNLDNKQDDVSEEEINEIFEDIENMIEEIPNNEIIPIIHETKKQFELNPVVLKQIYPNASFDNINKYLPYLNIFMIKYGINELIRIQMFLAQIGHESGELRYVEELASGKAYEGRTDLGNIHPGDGVRYKGRGLIQLTGRSNYTQLSKVLGHDLVSFPQDLCLPDLAVQSACWFWQSRGLNEVADTGDFRRVTRIINGGYNGMQHREQIYQLCKKYIKYNA